MMNVDKNCLMYNLICWVVSKPKNSKPTFKTFEKAVERYGSQKWYMYSYKEFYFRKHAYESFRWIKKNIRKDSRILEAACGAGGMLYHLKGEGFTSLCGYDYDKKSIDTAKTIAKENKLDIDFYIDNAYEPKTDKKSDVIVWNNGMYHLDNYTLELFFEKHIPLLNTGGYLVFDMVNLNGNIDAINSETYRLLLDSEEVENIAKKFELEKVYCSIVDSKNPQHAVYVYQCK